MKIKLIIWIFALFFLFPSAYAFSFNETHRYGFNESGGIDAISGLTLTEANTNYTNGSLREGNSSVIMNGNAISQGSSRFTTSSMETDWTRLSVNCWANITTRTTGTAAVYSQDTAEAGRNVHMGFSSDDGVASFKMWTHMPVDNTAYSSNISTVFMNTSHMYTWVVGINDFSHFFIDAVEQNKTLNTNASSGALQGSMCIGNTLGDAGTCNVQNNYFGGQLDDCRIWTYNLSQQNITDLYNNYTIPTAIPPIITYYNLTNENGCENWNTDKSNACSTSSVTPTVQFDTNKNAWCAIAGGSSSTALDLNYTDMNNSRKCTGDMSGEGGMLNHRCTLTIQDELVYDTSYIFISCTDSNTSVGNQNRNSTSGALKVSITGLETQRRNSIGTGIQNSLLNSYTNYTDLQIYARNLSNSQVKGTFDRAAKKGNKMWAFNGIGVSDSHVNMFNLTPVLYTLEFVNITSARITNLTELMINATK